MVLKPSPDWDPPTTPGVSFDIHRVIDTRVLGPLQKIALEMGELVTEKNTAYGDSFARSGEFLKLIYPKGARPDQYNDMLAFARMFDKMSRIATNEDAFGEDPARDLVGYAILMVAYHEEQREQRRQDKRDHPVQEATYAATSPGD